MLELKGYPGHHKPIVSIDTKKQKTIIRKLNGDNDDKYIYTPERVWIERPDGSTRLSRDNPRAAFDGHGPSTRWDELHLIYFCGYAIYNYLTTPFCFTFSGFQTHELTEHLEQGQIWRVLEVSFSDYFGTHCKVQKFYFNKKFMLQRIDYNADVVGALTAHFCTDHKEVGGLMFPTIRRAVARRGDLPSIFGDTGLLLDYSDLVVVDDNGQEWDRAGRGRKPKSHFGLF
jgi:hypothetical protein